MKFTSCQKKKYKLKNMITFLHSFLCVCAAVHTLSKDSEGIAGFQSWTCCIQGPGLLLSVFTVYMSIFYTPFLQFKTSGMKPPRVGIIPIKRGQWTHPQIIKSLIRVTSWVLLLCVWVCEYECVYHPQIFINELQHVGRVPKWVIKSQPTVSTLIHGGRWRVYTWCDS